MKGAQLYKREGNGGLKAAMKAYTYHWFDFVFVVIRTSWFALALRDLYAHPERIPTLPHPFLTTGYVGLVALWLTVSFLVPFFFYFSKHLQKFSPLAELVLSGGLFLYLSSSHTAFALYDLPVFTIGYFCTTNKSRLSFYFPTVILIPLTAGVLWNYSLPIIAEQILDQTIMFAIGVCFRMMISAHARMKELVEIIRQQNRTLEVYSEEIEKLTITAERNRLAGELHDTVGHSFTSAILGMDAVYYQMEKSPADARKLLKELIDFTRNSYTEVRQIIHQIAPPETDTSLGSKLARISNEFSHNTETIVKMEIKGNEKDTGPFLETVSLTLSRCLQEALTNAKRHGKASEIAVQLSFQPGTICLTVVDNGIGNENISSGFGLKSMYNRISSLNGSLEIQSTAEKGTTLTCMIPVKEGVLN